MKKRLFTPGPTPVPEDVMLRMARPIIHHRNPEFTEILERVGRNLRYLFQTARPVVTLTCSGTGGMESTFVSLFSAGDTVISVNGGKFGERWVRMPRAFGLNVVEIKVAWGEAVQPERISEALRKHPEAKGVYITHSETSTGTAADVKALAETVNKESEALICVDGITAIGALEFRQDDWGVDVCVTGSQKGLMIPPGLAFVSLSERAVRALEKSTLPRFYFDLRKALASAEKNDTPWTPAVSLIVGVDAALELIRGEGLEQVWSRHERLAEGLRSGISALGLSLFSVQPSNAVTAVRMPDGIDWKAFNKSLKFDNGITIAGGQDEYSGKIFRVSHLGYYDELDMITVVAGIERALRAVGWTFRLGTGLEATHRALLGGLRETEG